MTSIHDLSLSTRGEFKTGTFVKFSRSNLNRDLGQTTLPLFHGAAVVTNPPAPLGGVAIMHRGTSKDYAGFIGLRIYPLKVYKTHMQNFLTKNNIVDLMKNGGE